MDTSTELPTEVSSLCEERTHGLREGRVCSIALLSAFSVVLFLSTAPNVLTAELLPEASQFEKLPEDFTVGVLRSFPAPEGTQPSGLAFDGKYLWLSSYMRKGGIYRLNPEGGTILSNHKPPAKWAGYGGLAFDGTSLWHGSAYGEAFYRLRIPEVRVEQELRSPDRNPSDLAWDGSHLWFVGAASKKMMRMSRDGTVEEGVDLGINYKTGNVGITWDGSHLWVAAANILHKVDLEKRAVLLTSPLPHSRTESLAWDGRHLWAASFDKGIIYQLKVD